MYTPPPLKRRRTSPNVINPRNLSFNAFKPRPRNHAAVPDLNCNSCMSHPPHHPVHNDPPNDAQNDDETLSAFKSQLHEILQLFPPLIDLISFQSNPNQLFEELYHVFTSCSPHESPAIHHDAQPPPSHQCPSHDSHSNSAQFASVTCGNHNRNRLPPKPPPPPPDTVTSCHGQPGPIPPPLEAPTPLHERPPSLNRHTTIDPNCTAMFVAAKDEMMQKVFINTHLRCAKIIQSLNKTIHHKYGALRPQFTMNAQVQNEITYFMSGVLRTWDGGKPVRCATAPLTGQKAYKLVREYWNRQKAQQFGDTLFSLVLQNIFEIALQISELRPKQQVLFYIDLFCGLLSDFIHFERSQPRPVIPFGCFDKSVRFKRLCENILDAFSSGTLHMVHVQTRQGEIQKNGRKVTKYVKNRTRSAFLATSYANSLQDLKRVVLQASNTFIQHSIQMHLNWIKRSGSITDRPFRGRCQLIQWEIVDRSCHTHIQTQL